ATPRALLDTLAALLGGERCDAEGRAARLARRVQQLTPALEAKAVEDTALYREVSVLARNEVGCDPTDPCIGVAQLHAALAAAHAARPLALLATPTHDSKRGEDVRARLCALSEEAAGWATAVRGWVAGHRHLDPGGDAALVLLQTLAGAWPIERERAAAYLVK